MELAEQEGQVVLFYKYIKIAHPEEHADWHRNLCQRLKLTGKLRIAEEGLNGTLVSPPPNILPSSSLPLASADLGDVVLLAGRFKGGS